jgi:large subunit ribosomal protein L10
VQISALGRFCLHKLSQKNTVALTREKKVKIVSKIEDALEKAASIVFVNFHGLSVADATKLRGEMKKTNTGYTVVKKTLLRKVLGGLGYKGNIPELSGEVAIAYGADQVAPAKSAAEFAKKFEGKFSLLGGILEGRYLDASEAKALALIPNRETLYGQLVSVLVGPMRGTVTVFSGVQKGFVVALSEIAKKK